ncbi:plasma kallikrein-like [Xenia sp. Carnegie-2017]|uniref:plasma kallikrein-like n=1 Tax=Xenia sp. Carnegie-2017 TaxID=2897299 RepID=UPI001F0382B7|nr:plasma kallikrein-like [Xenia sp. Carnegie-2017]
MYTQQYIFIMQTGKECFITGWGYINNEKEQPNQLQQAKVPIVDIKICRKKYKGKKITKNMLCAGYIGVDSCNGDSGGPLVCKKAKKWYLTGITSFGEKCCGSNYGVYANVAKLSGWIKKILNLKLL